MEKTDEEIAKMVQSGHVDSFVVLIERYEAKMMRYGRKFLSGTEDIEDVIQNVFLKTYENIQSFDANRKFSSWVYRIAHNEFVNFLKKKKRTPIVSFDIDTLLPQFIKDEGNDILQEIELQQTKETLNKCLKNLDQKYREPLILYYFEQLSYKEIAEVMRIPVSTVGVRIKRGKESLRSILKNQN